MKRSWLWALVVVAAPAGWTWAEPALHVSDRDLVASDLIVVARIERATLVRHDYHADAKLIVAETLKGVAPGKIFDVRIRLLIVVGGYYKGPGRMVDLRGPRKDYPKTKMVLCEGKLYRRRRRLDVSKDAIWFLRKSKDESRYVVIRSGHAQALNFKPYFAALLSADPHGEVLKLLVHKAGDIRLRAIDYLAGLHRPADAVGLSRLLGDPDAVPLSRLLGDPDADVQARAASAMAEVGDLTTVPLLRKALTHDNPSVRHAACGFLCRFRDVESVAAIGKAMDGMSANRRRWIARDLRQMESPRAVPLLLELLDERLTPHRTPEEVAYEVSRYAAGSLWHLTAVDFPLDADRGRALWEKARAVPHQVLIGKAILAEIDKLGHPIHGPRYAAWGRLNKLTNRSIYPRFEGDRFGWEKLQRLWRKWAEENLTRARLEWIIDGFRAAGVELPNPMSKAGIETLTKVLLACEGVRPDGCNWQFRAYPGSSFYVYNANLLLERHTGHTVGLSPYVPMFLGYRQRHLLQYRWADWWRRHRAGIRLRPWPAERPVAREMLAETPHLGRGPEPLKLTIRPVRPAFAQGERVVMHVEVTNVSARDVLIARRPRNLRYARWGGGEAYTGHGPGSGQLKADFVTLKPGRSIRWDEKRGFAGHERPRTVKNFYYHLTYPFAGTQFGLRAWRGELLSDYVSYELRD